MTYEAKSIRIAIGVLAAAGMALTGCSVDGQIDKLAEKNDAMIEALEATESAEEAKKVYDKRKPEVEAIWNEVKGARGFQFTDESKQQLMTTAITGAKGVCRLKLRGVFDAKAKKIYGQMCDEYAKLLKQSPDFATTALKDDSQVEAFASDLRDARETMEKGEPMTVVCSTVDTYDDIAKKYGHQKKLAEFKRICEFEAPLKKLEKAVTEAEEARSSNPNAARLSECTMGVEKDMALDSLRSAGNADKPQVVKLKKRWSDACSKGS